MKVNKFIKYFYPPKRLALAVIVISIASLASAYIAEYGFGLKPCQLCLYQRVPYALNIVFGFFAFMASYKYPRLVTLLLWVSATTFLIGGAIALFHAGVEYGWWEMISSCTGSDLPSGSLEDLRAMIKSREEIVRCDIPAWTMFGISMAGYNFLASNFYALSLAYLLYLLKNRRLSDNF